MKELNSNEINHVSGGSFGEHKMVKCFGEIVNLFFNPNNLSGVQQIGACLVGLAFAAGPGGIAAFSYPGKVVAGLVMAVDTVGCANIYNFYWGR